MGKKDDYQYDYLDNYERFADQVNGALFGGRQVVEPDELEPADAMAVYLGKEAGARKNYRDITDKARTWRGRLIHIITIQNQTYVDYRMVLRNMLAESIGYHKQWNLKIKVMAGVDLSEEHEITENRKERYNMIKAFEDYKLEGKIEGKIEYLVQAVCKKLQKNKPAAVIADELEEELSEIEKVIEAQQKVGSYDVVQICKALS